MKALVVALLLLVAACSGACGATVPTVQTVPSTPSVEAQIAGYRQRTFQVRVECPDSASTGSGVYLVADAGMGLFATAAHVADPGCTYSAGGTPLTLVSRDAEADLALLTAQTALVFPQLEAAQPWLGMPVVHVGYPVQNYLGGKTGLQVSRGHLLADYGERQRVSASFSFGSSGGPVFDEDGHLVGIAVAGYFMEGQPIDDQYIISPADRLMEMASEAW